MNALRALLLLLLTTNCLQARTWTDQRGRTVEADLVSVRDGAAVLRKANGQEITIKLASLSFADRKFISENKPAPATNADDEKGNANAPFGFAKVELKGNAKTHPSDGKQQTQDVVIQFTEGKRTADAYTLRVAFVSGSPDGEISPMAFRAPPEKAGFGNGHATYPLSKEQLNITELTIPLPRYRGLAFIGYRFELLDGETVVDQHHWENGPLLETIVGKLLLDKNFWYKGVFKE